MITNKGLGEKTIVCPYEPSHVLLASRVQTHLVKCRRNHPASKKTICLYNSTHQVPEIELKYHHEICPDRLGLDKFVFVPENVNRNRFPLENLNVQASENWDDEVVPSYDPNEHCRKNTIMRNTIINTLPPAQKRKFRMEERQRMQQLVDQKPQPVQVKPKELEQLRRPVGESRGMNSIELEENDLFDCESLMKKLEMGANVLTTPKIPLQNSNDAGTEDACAGPSRMGCTIARNQQYESNVDFEPENANQDFPPLGITRGSRGGPRRGYGRGLPKRQM